MTTVQGKPATPLAGLPHIRHRPQRHPSSRGRYASGSKLKALRSRSMEDTWASRDLPVLGAVVSLAANVDHGGTAGHGVIDGPRLGRRQR